MRKEKLVKKQAREALRGNTIPIIAGISLAAMIFIMLQNALYLIWLSFNAIDVETEQMKDGFELPYLLGTAAVVIAATLLSPFVNGAYKAAANAVSENNCEVTDLFYFFRGARRYLKTMVINMGLFLFFGTLNLLFGFGIKSLFGADGALGVVGAVIGGMITFLLYSLILHYPLCLYGIDDSQRHNILEILNADKIDLFPYYGVKLADVRLIELRDKHKLNSVLIRRHTFFLETAYRQDLASQGYLTGHGYIAAGRL